MNKSNAEVPIRFRGEDLTGGYVFGVGAFYNCGNSYIVTEFHCRVSIVRVKTGSIRQLAGYDSKGKEVYEGDTLYIREDDAKFYKEYETRYKAFATSSDGCWIRVFKGRLKNEPQFEEEPECGK